MNYFGLCCHMLPRGQFNITLTYCDVTKMYYTYCKETPVTIKAVTRLLCRQEIDIKPGQGRPLKLLAW